MDKPKYPGTRLCEKCSAIRFDDGRFGGYKGISKDGEIVLRHFPIPAPLRPRALALDYSHDDNLPDLPHLEASAKLGCGFCHLLREVILQRDFEGVGPMVNVRLSYIWDSPHSYRQHNTGLNALVAYLCTKGSDLTPKFVPDDLETGREYFQASPSEAALQSENICSFTFMLESGLGTCNTWLQLPDAPKSETWGNENILAVRGLIERCDFECHNPSFDGARPTRLIDLEACGACDGIRLVKTESLPSGTNIKYAALTYCWGSESDALKQSKTELGTLAMHLSEIPISYLSPIIRDAVEVARALSIQYLWVDSLCIIQDDIEDWESESQKMGAIYEGAYLTICPIASSSCQEGFLHRVKSLEIGFRSSIQPSVLGTYGLRYVRKCDPVSRIPDLDKSHWYSRGWTFQEYVCSTRTLIFGQSNVSFICPQKTVVEPFSNACCSIGSILDFSGFNEMIRDGSRIVQLDNLWYALVVEYSGRMTTVPEDKLPAISGLAKRFATRFAQSTGRKYLAGLWSTDLAFGLLWDTSPVGFMSLEDNLSTKLHPATYVAPSWSWASQKGRTRWPSELKIISRYPFRAEYEDVSGWTQHERGCANPFGRILDAKLFIKSKVQQLKTAMTEMVDPELDQQLWTVQFGTSYAADCLLDWGCKDGREILNHDVSLLLIASAYQEAEQNSPDEDICPADEEDLRDAHGLLICPAGRDETYFRIGVFGCGSMKGGVGAFRNCSVKSIVII